MPDELLHSPLEAAHLALGAKLVPFGGWNMPLAYPSGTVAEHSACRTSAVVFDVSHLGTVRLEGNGARAVLQETLTNDLDKIGPDRAQYTHLLDNDGFVTDDIIIWWVDQESFDVMPNASNTTSVLAAIGGTDVTATRAVLAIQGPDARAMLHTVAPDAASVPRFAVRRFDFAGVTCTAAGTGYTGEDGVECAVPVAIAPAFFDAVIGAGITPAGLGARDTLRLEAALPLHGHELGAGITPLQAGLSWVVGWNKANFRGRDALLAERERGVSRRLVGMVTEGRQPPREGALIKVGEQTVGTVTSGNFSPMLGSGIALGFVDTDASLAIGDRIELEVRAKRLAGTITKLPFWPQSKGN